MIWIRSQFAKGLAEPSISTSQQYIRVWTISPFPQIDALHPLRYDLFLFFSSQSCATWSLWCVTKRTKLSKFWGSSGTGINGQEGKSLQVQQALVQGPSPGYCRCHSASSSLQPPPIMKRNSWRFETPWK